jgi:hypothetical protein
LDSCKDCWIYSSISLNVSYLLFRIFIQPTYAACILYADVLHFFVGINYASRILCIHSFSLHLFSSFFIFNVLNLKCNAKCKAMQHKANQSKCFDNPKIFEGIMRSIFYGPINWTQFYWSTYLTKHWI